MKKILLLVITTINFMSYGQGNSCGNATPLNANGTYSCSSLTTGSYQPICFAAIPGINGKWFKFTPSSNGQVSISSNLEINQGIDTRVSVMSGTCGTLVCLAANDDFDPNLITNRLSALFLPVEAGITYYIQWDSRGDTSAFQFDYTFTESTCLPLNQFAAYDPLYVASNSATLKWNNALGTPENYLVEWTADFDPIQSINTTSNIFTADNGGSSIKTIENLPSGENISYFVSSLCGTSPNFTGQSARRGPYMAFLARNLPYSLSFEEEFPFNVFNDGFIGFNTFFTNENTEPANYADGGEGRAAVTSNSTEEFSDRWGYSRGLNLVAGQQVTISFKSRLFAFNDIPSPMSMKVTAGLSQNPAAQLNLISDVNLTNFINYSTHSATFIAPTTDVYYFGFQNNSPPGVNQSFAFLDTFSFTSLLSDQSFLKSQSKFLPNPTAGSIQFFNSDIAITKIQILDLNGRTIIQTQPENSLNTTVDVKQLLKGIYLIRTTTEKGSQVQKLIKD